MYAPEDTDARDLDMGAADYLVKPFSPTELAARVRAALRERAEPFAGEPAASYDAGGLIIDSGRRWPGSRWSRRCMPPGAEPERAAGAVGRGPEVRPMA